MKPQLLAIAATLAFLFGCATTPSGRVEDVIEAKATVKAIDPQQRLVTLKDETGDEFVAEVADAVEGLDKVQVGDQVVVSYSAAVAWKVRPKGQEASAFSADAVASPVKSGDQVAASISESGSITGTISAIDQTKGTVTLAWPDGTSDTIKARDPANLKKVKVGDVVDILYSEALAVSLRPVSAK
jgi:Cu/Ag efflux protein CusF